MMMTPIDVGTLTLGSARASRAGGGAVANFYLVPEALRPGAAMSTRGRARSPEPLVRLPILC